MEQQPLAAATLTTNPAVATTCTCSHPSSGLLPLLQHATTSFEPPPRWVLYLCITLASIYLAPFQLRRWLEAAALLIRRFRMVRNFWRSGSTHLEEWPAGMGPFDDLKRGVGVKS